MLGKERIAFVKYHILRFHNRFFICTLCCKFYLNLIISFQVPLRRVHMFTIIQLTCLVVLWIIKSFSSTSILFPLMLVVMIGIRKSLDFVFTRRELMILDDVMPEITKRNQADKGKLDDPEVGWGTRFIKSCIGKQ